MASLPLNSATVTWRRELYGLRFMIQGLGFQDLWFRVLRLRQGIDRAKVLKLYIQSPLLSNENGVKYWNLNPYTHLQRDTGFASLC